jgi:hypothetical protein
MNFHTLDALTPLTPSPGMLPGEGEHHPTPGMDPSPMHGRGDQGVREHKEQYRFTFV